MTLTDRDRKILIAVVPLVVVLGYWFLLLAPKREEASTAATQLAKQEKRLAVAKSADSGLASAKTDFAADYSELVRLGKAVPSTVDMPSLIVQLETAARGTGIRFSRIATGERAPAPAAPAAGDAKAADAGGTPAQSGPGKGAESANNASQASDDKNAATDAATTNTQTSTTSGKGVPVGGGSAGSAPAPVAAGTAPAGLDTVPLELEFQGGFFDLADFFHRLKRFVRAKDGQIDVRGRLVSVDGLKFSSTPEIFPRLKAEITATAYLAPKTQGETAGATPDGPAPAGPQTASANPTTPAATTP